MKPVLILSLLLVSAAADDFETPYFAHTIEAVKIGGNPDLHPAWSLTVALSENGQPYRCPKNECGRAMTDCDRRRNRFRQPGMCLNGYVMCTKVS